MSMVRPFSDRGLMASLTLAIIVSVPASAQNADQSVMANLVIQVQELQDEVRNLRGQLEEQSRELGNLKRRQRRVRAHGRCPGSACTLDWRVNRHRNCPALGTEPDTGLDSR